MWEALNPRVLHWVIEGGTHKITIAIIDFQCGQKENSRSPTTKTWKCFINSNYVNDEMANKNRILPCSFTPIPVSLKQVLVSYA